MSRICKLNQLLCLDRRKAKVIADADYPEIGIYSFFKGIFHKSPRKGWDVGDKDLYLIKENDFIFQITFAWEGAVAIASKEDDNLYGSVRFPTFRVNSDLCNPQYLLWWFQTKKGRQRLYDVSPGSALRNRVLNIGKLLETEITLPPLDLQNKLVSKLNDASLEQQNIDHILREESETLVHKLRQAILQEAVSGKLVPQSPNDESASELLKKIKVEKERLIEEKKIKRGKDSSIVSEEETPYGLPKGWVWVRLGEITNYGYSEKTESADLSDDAWVLDLEDIEKTSSKLLVRMTFKDRKSKSTKNVFKAGDVLYSKLRPYLDKVLVAPENGVCTTEILPIRAYFGVYPQYIRIVLKSPQFMKYVNSVTHGMKMPRLGTKDGQKALFPLPPLGEQLRIVQKVDQITTLCDELEQKVRESQEISEFLMEAVLKEAFVS
jgi:restriction endonuclease S subunit